MSKKQKFWQIIQSQRTADINIYGDITSFPWFESDVASFNIKQEIDALDVDTINVYINSYGGEVAEALAIYSALKRNPAQVHTYCDGFACSAATIVFAAGDVRTMGSIALLMIHNCMSYAGFANSDELRKLAEDNDKINQSSIEAYKKISNLSEDEIKSLMDNETWLTAQECLEMGFATDIADTDEGTGETVQQSAFMSIRQAVLNSAENNSMQKAVEVLQSTANRILAKMEEKVPEPKPQNTYEKAADFFKKFL